MTTTRLKYAHEVVAARLPESIALWKEGDLQIIPKSAPRTFCPASMP
jgi:hypothetical protein